MKRGLTLVETLITTLLLVLTVVALYTLLELGYNTYWSNRAYLDAQESARLVIGYVAPNLMEAVPHLPTIPAVSLPNITQPISSDLIFNRALHPFDPLRPQYEQVRYVYNSSTHQVDLYVNGQKTRSIGRNVKDFKVRRISDILYEITVTTEVSAGRRTLSYTLNTSVHLPYGTL